MERRALIAALPGLLAAPGSARAAPDSVAHAFAAALTAHDLAAFAALFSDDYQQHQTSAAAPPPKPGMTAKQATQAYFTARLAALPDLTVTADPVVQSETWVAANFSYAGTHTGAAYFGVPPSGRAIRFTSCDILYLRDGLIAAHWGAADIAGLMVQLRGG